MHTPGPWKVAPKGYLSICPVTDCGNLGTAIASAVGDGVVVAGTNCNDDREANARLIAAAPGLLAALKEALPALDYCNAKKADVARATIAEAEGEGA